MASAEGARSDGLLALRMRRTAQWSGVSTSPFTFHRSLFGLAAALLLPGAALAAEPGPAALPLCAFPSPELAFPGCEAKRLLGGIDLARKPPLLGIVSYYARKFHGRRTASGAKFDNGDLTAAHLTLPFGTLVKVTNLHNNRSVLVRVNDRGPHVRGRVLDLSRAAARALGILSQGLARVAWEVIPPSPGGPTTDAIAAAR